LRILSSSFSCWLVVSFERAMFRIWSSDPFWNSAYSFF
jgi:hypothetical protein